MLRSRRDTVRVDGIIGGNRRRVSNNREHNYIRFDCSVNVFFEQGADARETEGCSNGTGRKKVRGRRSFVKGKN